MDFYRAMVASGHNPHSFADFQLGLIRQERTQRTELSAKASCAVLRRLIQGPNPAKRPPNKSYRRTRS